MCRLRIPGGIVSAWQFRGLADAADAFGGGYADVTTRANLQIREIGAAHAVDLLTGGAGAGPHLARLGRRQHPQHHRQPDRRHRPAGADRHAAALPAPCTTTSSTTARCTACRASSTSPSTAAGASPALEDTNDIGFVAVPGRRRAGVEPGVYFRLQLGGITGHKDFARETGVLLKPDECVPVAGAVVRVFIDHGDRTDRKKARLKYVLDRMGPRDVPRGGREGIRRAAAPCRRCRACAPRPMADKHGHVGVHAQKQAGPQLSRRRAAGRPDDVRADARPGRDRRPLRQRHDPADRLAEPADLRHRRPRRRHLHRRHRGARPGRRGERDPRAAWSPAPATPAASSRPPTPRAMRCGSPTISKRAWPSTRRSTSTSPAATIPAPSTMSATSACSPQGRRSGEDSVEGYHVYIGGGAASTAEQAMAREYAQSVRVRRSAAAARAPARGLARPSRRRPARSFFEFCRRHEIAALRELAGRAPLRGARGMNAMTPIPSLIPENAPFSTRAARLAERLLRRLSRRRRRAAGRGERRGARQPTSPTRISPGTTRRWPWPSGWSLPRTASRSAS